MKQAWITDAYLKGNTHVYFITLESSVWGDKKFIVYDNDGDGTIGEGDEISRIRVEDAELEKYTEQAKELITQFQQDLPKQLMRFRKCWGNRSFGENEQDEYVLDNNKDKKADKLKFKIHNDEHTTEVRIEVHDEDAKVTCSIKDGQTLPESIERTLTQKQRRESPDVFDCKAPEPRGVAQYFHAFNNPEKDMAVACESHMKNEPTIAERFSEFAHEIEHGISGVASTAYSWSSGVVTSTGNYLSALWNNHDDDEEEGKYSSVPFKVGLNKL